MCIQAVGLGIRELQRVSDFLTIGYDLSYDSAYVKNESVVLFPEDFE